MVVVIRQKISHTVEANHGTIIRSELSMLEVALRAFEAHHICLTVIYGNSRHIGMLPSVSWVRLATARYAVGTGMSATWSLPLLRHRWGRRTSFWSNREAGHARNVFLWGSWSGGFASSRP